MKEPEGMFLREKVHSEKEEEERRGRGENSLLKTLNTCFSPHNGKPRVESEGRHDATTERRMPSWNSRLGWLSRQQNDAGRPVSALWKETQ